MFRVRGVLASFAVVSAISAAAQQPADPRPPQPFAEHVDVTAIELMVDVRDAKGEVPRGLTPADFTVLEDGKPQQVIGVEYLSPEKASATSFGTTQAKTALVEEKSEWRVVIYFDFGLANLNGVKKAAKSLSESAEKLVALGPVDIGVAKPSPKLVLEGSRDVVAIRKVLADIEAHPPAQSEIQEIRRGYYIARPLATLTDTEAIKEQLKIGAITAAKQEVSVIRRHRDHLLGFIGRYDHRSPKALLLVNDGFDLDPIGFYVSTMPDRDLGREIVGELQTFSSGKPTDTFLQELAARHWTITTLATNFRDVYHSGGIEQSGYDYMANPTQSLPGSKGDAPPPMNAAAIAQSALGPLERAAQLTGGSVVTDVSKVAVAVSRLGDRIRVTYQVPRAGDFKLHKIEVKLNRPGFKVLAPQRDRTGSSEEVANARARNLLVSGTADPGELTVQCGMDDFRKPSAKNREATLLVRADATALGPLRAKLGSTNVRYSVAVEEPDTEPAIRQDLLTAIDLANRSGLEYRLPMKFTTRSRKVAVVVEEMSTGSFGSCVMPLSPEGAPALPPLAMGSAGPAPAAKSPALPMAASVADRLAWAPSLDAALAHAAAEHKLVLLYLRGACGNCNDASDVFLAQAAGHESVVQALGGVIPVRADVPAGAPAGDKLADWIRAQKVPAPTLIVVGPDGSVVTLWGALADVGAFANELSAVRQQTDSVFRAAELRSAGREDEADLELGTALVRAGDNRRAREKLEHAAELARAGGNEARAQLAEMNLAFALSNDGDPLRGLELVQRITSSPASRENEAAAWVVVGSMKRAMKDGGGAVEAYRHAYEVAPAQGDAEATALRYLERFDKQPLPAKLSVQTGAVQLLAPKGSVLSGRQTFSAKTLQGVRRVELLLDDRAVATLDPPFTTTIDLGPAARAHVIRAIARDETGKLLGEDSITVNPGVQALDVKLIAPAATTVSGPTVVEATAAAPMGHEIKRVQLFWNETPVASLQRPPYRATVDVPAGRTGYFRAVAVLDDGRTVEDTRLVNAAGASEAMSVEQVELYARVLDASGAPVRGLAARDFTVRDEETPVKVNVRQAADDPLTIGLVVDTSGSMSASMLELKEAAARFLRETIGPRDQAFAVSFDIAPRLLHPLSNDLGSLTKTLYDVHASGDTSVYDALVYSLQQFQSTGGKKALIVFTDGVDLASKETAAACARLARQSGVPIYVMLMSRPPAAAATTAAKTTAKENRAGASALSGLREIVESTGGAIHTNPTAAQLAALFASIREQLRGEYMVTWTPPARSTAGWRKVTIGVPGRGFTVRAINGYFEK
jgi:Ca-activated chloride channel family protein